MSLTDGWWVVYIQQGVITHQNTQSQRTHMPFCLTVVACDVLQIEDEFNKILSAKTGDPETPFALTSAASKEVGAGINTGIQ